MSAVTSAGMLLRIRQTHFSPSSPGMGNLLPDDSGRCAWVIGTKFDEVSGAGPTRDAPTPPSAHAPGTTSWH